MKTPYRKFCIPFTNISFIKWEPSVITPIHKHNHKNCNFLVLKGTLKETIYKEIPQGYYLSHTKELSPYQSSHINDNIGAHTIENLSNKFSWSVHHYK